MAFRPDTLFRTGTAIHGRDGIVCREATYSKPKISFRFYHDGVQHWATYGRYNDGRVASIKMDGDNANAARLVSLILQRGIEIEECRRVLTDGALATALDRIMLATYGGPRSASFRWLQKVGYRQTLNRRRTTQTWKHWAEADEGQYTSVEEFHTAAIALGFKLQPIRGTPNAYANIAEPKKTKRTYR